MHKITPCVPAKLADQLEPDPLGYHEPSCWLDQMRRIHKLFMTELSNDANN